ncbi:MAG: hypothetical protein ACJ75S_08655 [Solirubrobacterales bacterium]
MTDQPLWPRGASAGKNDVVLVEQEAATQVRPANPRRNTLTLTNDSENTIYVFKGAGAAVGKGLRLNKEGGAIVISDYNGEVTAAAKGGKSNLLWSED